MIFFTQQINNWNDWSNVFQSIPAFSPLIRYILRGENLPETEIELLTPGTNAVFRVGEYVIKIFAPKESGIDQTLDLQTELFSIKHANKIGISVPKFVAEGFVDDKYRFAYMITEYIKGQGFCDVVKNLSEAEKQIIGQKLRQITDKLNKSCKPFNHIDITDDKERSDRWDKYPDNFKQERLAYITSYDFGERVFVHGHLCCDNILITPDGKLYIIDFADAVLAPILYEQALVAVELFNFDQALLRGYFGDYSVDELTDICYNGLLIHDFGGDILASRIASPDKFNCLEDLKNQIRGKIEQAKIIYILNQNYAIIFDKADFMRDAGSISYIVYSGAEKYFLRITKPTMFDNVIKAVDVNVFLQNIKFQVPTIIFTKQNNPCVQVIANNEGCLYILYEFIDGEEVDPEKDAEVIGEIVGKLQNLS